MSAGALVAESVTKRFGGLIAVDDLSLRVDPGQIVALIGPNGAGKTTFFNCLTGLLEPDSGRIHLGDADITRWGTARRARAGIGRTFQRLQVFTRMTVAQNLQVAAEAATGGVIQDLLTRRARHEGDAVGTVNTVLDRLGLAWCANELAGNLPTGVLRLVELGRALCTAPGVLLLDETASGLDDTETDHLAGVLTGLAGEGVGVLLVEHDVPFVLDVAEMIYVLDFGKVIARGAPDEIAADATVRAAYLGTESVGTR